MVTKKPFHELNVGDYIADMHYGVVQLKARFDVVSHVRWNEPDLRKNKNGYVAHAFYDYLQEFLPGGSYMNKNLHVIGFADDSTMSNPVIIAGYCYDGRRSGIVVLKQKKATV